MNRIIDFSEREKARLLSFLQENLVGTDPRPQEFADFLFKAVNQDSDFYRVLREWFNYSVEYTDIVVNGFSLNQLADFYVDRKIGILVALRLLWQEKNGLTGICLTVGESCYADKSMMEHQEAVDLAYLNEGVWCFFGKNYESNDDHELGAFELYRVCENDPALIELVTSTDDISQDNIVVERTGKSDFTMYIDDVNE